MPVPQSDWMNTVQAHTNSYGTSTADYASLEMPLYDLDTTDNLSSSHLRATATAPATWNELSNDYSATKSSLDRGSTSTSSQDHTPNFISPDTNDPSPQTNISSPRSTSSKADKPVNRVEKRTRNTLAARRYRQKRVDEMSNLESTLKETQSERDALKVRVARLEGELEAMKSLMKSRG